LVTLTFVQISTLIEDSPQLEEGAVASTEALMEIAERLVELDPVRTYPQRGAALVANLVGATAYRLDRPGAEAVESESASIAAEPTLSLPLRHERSMVGTLHLETPGAPEGADLEFLKWASRIFAHGLDYVARLAEQRARKPGEAVRETLLRAPLTPRERDVVTLLISGASTRSIASQTGLTVSTVNTYLKRIFSKLGVHSRVELIARMAGTASPSPREPFDYTHADS
jgi:DNA-binding CsgD family transcriptional regulator